MGIRVDIRDSAAAIWLPFAKKRLKFLKRRLDEEDYEPFTIFREETLRVDAGTKLYVKAYRSDHPGIDVIRVESGMPVLYLFHTVNQNFLCFDVTQSAEGIIFVRNVTNIMLEYKDRQKHSLSIVGRGKGLPHICDSGQDREIAYLKADAYLGFVDAPTPYHDRHIDDGIWCYNYIALLRKWFPVNFEWFFYGAEYGVQNFYMPVDIGKRNWQTIEVAPETSEPYGETVKCSGRHPFEMYEDPDDPELHMTLLYKDIRVEGDVIHVPFPTSRHVDLSFFATMYGTRKRVWQIVYNDGDTDEKTHELFTDISDVEARTCTQYTPLAVISHDKCLYHVDNHYQNETPVDATYSGSIGRYGEHQQYHTYCCAYIYIAMRILYRDPGSGDPICEEVAWIVKLTCSQNMSSHQTLNNEITEKEIKLGELSLASDTHYTIHRTYTQNVTKPFYTVGKGDRPLPQIECPWPAVPSGANDWNLLPGQDEREVRTWGAPFKSGPLRYSDHVSDPLTGYAPVNIEDTKEESGIADLSIMDYDNYKDEQFIAIIRKVEVDNKIIHTTLFYFNEDADIDTYKEIQDNDRYRVNEGPTSYEWKTISAYPVIQSFTGKIFYLVDGKPRIVERNEEDRRTYHYEMVVLVDGVKFTFPIQWTGYETYTYKFESVQEINQDLLQVSELTGPVYPVQTVIFESQSTLSNSGNRIREVSTFINRTQGLMGYTYVVQKALGNGTWVFYKRVIGAVSLLYIDDEERPVSGEIVIDNFDEDYEGFDYSELCALGIKS